MPRSPRARARTAALVLALSTAGSLSAVPVAGAAPSGAASAQEGGAGSRSGEHQSEGDDPYEPADEVTPTDDGTVPDEVTRSDDEVVPDEAATGGVEAPPVAPPAADAGLPHRVEGRDRVATSIAVARDRYPDGERAAVLASAGDFADALAGASLADHVDGPLLLTQGQELDSRVVEELTDHLEPGATVWLLGGTDALGEGVEDAVADLGFATRRLAGPDRYGTATAIAQEVTGDDQGATEVILATGTDFADGASASGFASEDRVLLFTRGDVLPAATAEELARLAGASDGSDPEAVAVTAVGGSAARAVQSAPRGVRSSLDVTPVVGEDRYATSAALMVLGLDGAGGDGAEGAGEQADGSGTVTLASGLDYADALIGGTYGHRVVLTAPDRLPEPVAGALAQVTVNLNTVIIIGGTRSVTDVVAAEAAAIASGAPSEAPSTAPEPTSEPTSEPTPEVTSEAGPEPAATRSSTTTAPAERSTRTRTATRATSSSPEDEPTDEPAEDGPAEDGATATSTPSAPSPTSAPATASRGSQDAEDEQEAADDEDDAAAEDVEVGAGTTAAPTAQAAGRGRGTWSSGAVFLKSDSGRDFSQWRGEPATITSVFADRGDGNQRNLWGYSALGDWSGDVDLAPGMITRGETMADAASGRLDERWREAARTLHEDWGNKDTVYLRIAHEMNGDWFAWSVTRDNAEDFKAGWRRYYRIIQEEVKAKGRDVRVVFCLNKDPKTKIPVDVFYPGDEYVDMMGVDFYDAYPTYPDQEAWDREWMKTKAGSPLGLGAHLAFAREHGKSLGIGEWGVSNHGRRDNPFFIRKMREAFAANAGTGPGQLEYEVYFNTLKNIRIWPETNVPAAAEEYRKQRWGSS